MEWFEKVAESRDPDLDIKVFGESYLQRWWLFPRNRFFNIYLHKIEDKLREIFGTKVSIRSRKEGGNIEIQFYSPEDLNRLIEIFDKYHAGD